MAGVDSTLLLSFESSDGNVWDLHVDFTAPVTIGRDPQCQVVLPSPEVSRKHATIERVGQLLRLTDSSANGTWVGQERVVRGTTQVALGQPVRIGPYVLRVRTPGEAGGVTAFDEQGGAIRERVDQHIAAQGKPTQPKAPPPPGKGPRPKAEDMLLAAPGAIGPADAGTSAPGAGTPAAVAAARSRAATLAGGGVPATSAPTIAPMAMGAATIALPQGAALPVPKSSTSAVTVETRRKIHRMLLDHLDLVTLDRSKMGDAAMRPRVREALKRITTQIAAELPQGTDVVRLIDELTDEALGLGPLEQLLADKSVSEIMVVDPITIYVEKSGRIVRSELRFTDDEAVRSIIERIVTPLGRRIDESTPLVDARLKDGSRVNAIIRPLALRGACITIRKFAKHALGLDDLIGFGALSPSMAKFLTRSVIARKNVVISGGTGSGKTTLLNVLSGAIPADERVVTIEDAAELRLKQPHVVSLESRPPNMEGRGEVSIRDLVRNALRMRPDRIVVGECRGGEALDMMQAMNTGHDGSMTTTHANSPREALSRLETLALMSGLDLPSRAIREQLSAAVHVIVQQTRFSDGTRRITSIAEVAGLDHDGELEVREIFRFERTGMGDGGAVLGEFRATGYLPSFIDEFIKRGLVPEGDYL